MRKKIYRLVNVVLVCALAFSCFMKVENVFALDTEIDSGTAEDSGLEDLSFESSFDIEGNAYKWNGGNQTSMTYDTSNTVIIDKNKIYLGNSSWLINTGRDSATVWGQSKASVSLDKSFLFEGSVRRSGNCAGYVVIGLRNGNESLHYEIDFANDRVGGTWDEPELGDRNVNLPHIGMVKRLLGGSAPVWHAAPKLFASNTASDKRDFTMEYDKDSDTINVNWGGYLQSYTGVKEFFGKSAKLDIIASTNASTDMYIQADSFKYTDIDSKSVVDYYTKRNDTLVKYDKDDVTKYPQPGETVLVRHTIHNDTDTAEDQSATANISIAQVDGVNRTASNLKAYTGSPSEQVAVTLDETDIFNGAKDSNDVYKQATIPLPKNKGNTYIEYEYTIPTDKKYSTLEDTIVFGQKGMTQTTFTNTSKIANAPYLTGVDNTVSNVLSTGIMSDSEIKDSITGKLFDGSAYSDIITRPIENMDFSYTVDGSKTKTIDKSKEGRYRIDYTAKDNRTNLVQNNFRYIWNTNKQVVINTEESMAAQDFTMLCKEVEKAQTDGNLIDIIKERSGVEAYKKDGTKIPLEDITVTHSMTSRAGDYQVTFTTPGGTSTTVNVNCSVYEHSIIDPVTKEIIFANDFTVSEDETASLDDNKLMELSNVMAKDKNGKKVTVKVKENTVQNKTQGRYPVTFITDAGTKITINVQVTKKYFEANGEKIMGNDFYMSAKDAKKKDESQLLSLGKVEARDANTKLDVHVNADALLPERGTYPIIYTTDKGTSLTLQVTVMDREDIDVTTGEAIYANNFSLEQEEAKDILDETIKQKANAKAINIDGGNEVDITTVGHNIKAAGGLYDVSFQTEKKTKLTVISSIPNTIENDTLILAANDFTTSVQQIENGLQDSDYIKMARAEAKEKDTANNVPVLVSDKSSIKALPGTYGITFDTDYPTDPSKNLSLSVKLDVKQIGIIDTINKESIFANHLYLKKSEVKELQEKDIIKKTEAVGYNSDTGEYVDVYVEHDIKEAVGTYVVKLYTAKGTQVLIDAYVYDNESINTDTLESMYGNDVIITKQEVATLSDQILKDQSNVKAYNTITKQEVAITKVNRSAIKASKGTYVVTFETAKGTKLNIDVRVVDHEKEENGIKLVGDDIYLSSKEVKTLSEDKIIELAKAKAIDIVTNETKEVHADYANIKSETGVYDVIVKAEGVEIVIQAHVYDNGDNDGQEVIHANDFTLSVKQASVISNTTIKRLSNVIAFDNTSGQEITVDIIHTIEAKKGKYDVVFVTKQGTTLTVSAYVRDDVNEENGEQISANDIQLSKEEVKTLTQQSVIEKAHVQAIEVATGKKVKVHANYQAIKEQRGSYDVIFTTDLGTSVKVQAHVYDSGIVDETTKEAIYANDFTLGQNDVSILNKEEAIKRSNAYAVDMITGEEVSITQVVYKISETNGKYPVTFKTQKKTERTVDVEVYGNAIEDPKTNEAIKAEDIYLSKSDVKTLNEQQVLQLSKAKAYDLSSKEPRSIRVDYSSVQEKQGQYDIILSTQKGTRLTIHAYVMDHGIIDVENKEKMVANDFQLTIQEAQTISDQEIIKKSDAKAYNIETYEEVKIEKVTHTIQTKKGKYEVSMSTQKGTTITIQVEVIEQEIELPVISGDANILPESNPLKNNPWSLRRYYEINQTSVSGGSKTNTNDSVDNGLTRSNQTNTYRNSEKQYIDETKETCTWHWGMLAVIVIYGIYMVISIKKEEQ